MENDDGGITIDVVPEDTKPAPPAHDDNLAEHMDESTLDKIATQVIEGVRIDKESRKEWESTLTQAMDFLGLKFTDRDFPFDGASGVYDTVMLEAALRNTAQTCAELLPAAGPAKTQIIGTTNEEVNQKASRVQSWMNFYLLEGAPEWVEQMEQMFFWRSICGSVYKKVYQDPILNRPVSPFITPDKLVVSYYADTEMETCPRVTHIIDFTYKQMRERQLSGFYRDIDLVNPESPEQTEVEKKVDSIVGLTRPQPTDNEDEIDRDFQCFEQHVDIDLAGFEHEDESGARDYLPIPYIITVEVSSRKVLSIRRNWREDDKTYSKVNFFVHYRYSPGLGHYGLGLAHQLGNSAKATTSLIRQLSDAESLSLFPGGLRVKGMRLSDNNKLIGPTEFLEIDTGGLPIQQAIMTMPYKGASEVSLALYNKIRENAQALGSVSDLSVGDGRQDAPVGTTLALLEAANRMMSATIKSAHRALKKEFKLFAALFGQYLPEKPYPFAVPGGQMAIMRTDFSGDVDVIPVSDPNITSYAQRVTQAEARLRIAQQFPQVHDIRAACRQMYVAMNTNEGLIDAILPQPQEAQPLEPLTENQNALVGKPLKVGDYQDHQAHIKAHQVLSDQVPSIAAHIAEHLAAAMRLNVEKLLGIQLPPAGTPLPPDVENKIALLVAQALQQLNTPQGPEPTPGQIAMEEIKVEAQKVAAQLEDIKAKAATAAFQAQQKYLTDEKDRQERMMKAEADRRTQVQIATMREGLKVVSDHMKAQQRNAIGRSPQTYN